MSKSSINKSLELLEARMWQAIEGCNPGASVVAASRYHLQSGGQRTRARLALQACDALCVGESDAIPTAACVELLHNASLVHDDLQDRDQSRRGAQSLWAAFGDDVALCTGDLMLSAATSALAEIDSIEHLSTLLKLTHHRVTQTIRGQAADLRAESDLTLVEYELIAGDKSSALLSLPIEAALILAKLPQHIEIAADAMRDFAIAYQITDDLADANLDAIPEATSKRPRLNVLLLNGSTDSLCTERVEALLASFRYKLLLLPPLLHPMLESLADTLEQRVLEH